MASGRIVRQVADAFVDGAAIDWDAVWASASTPADKQAIAQYRALDGLRAVNPSRTSTTDRYGHGIATAITWLATVQLAVMLLGDLILWIGGATFSDTSQLIAVIAFAAAAAMLFPLRTTHVRIRALTNVYLVGAIALGRALFSGPAFTSTWPWMRQLAALVSAVAVEGMLAFSLWQFAVHFPAVTRFTRFDRVGRRLLAPLAALGVCLLGAGLFKIVGLPERLSAVALFYRPSNLYSSLIAVPMLGAIVAIAVRSRRAEGDERTRVRRFGISMAIGTAPFLMLGLGLTLWPPFNRWFLASPQERAPIDFVVRLGLAFLPIATALAVISDRALDVRVAISRATRYVLTRTLLAAMTAVPLALIAWLLYQQRDVSIGVALSGARGYLLMAWLGFALLLLFSRERILRVVDARFGHRDVNHRAEFAAALERVKNARGLRETTQTVTSEIRALLQTRTAAVLDVELDRNSALAAVLQQDGGCVDASSAAGVFTLLPDTEKAWLAGHGFDSLTAIRRRDGSLLAVIAVGPKHSGLGLTDDDRWLLESFASVMAVVWEAPPSEQSDAAFECPACGVVSESAARVCECGRALQPAALPATLNAKFRLNRRIGRGGMGVVYAARDIELDRLVAVKTLPSASPETIAQLRKEARAMASLNHPGLAGIFGVEVWQHTPSLVVEYCQGGTLADLLRKERLAAGDAVRLGLTVLDTLTYMHQLDVTHRDIKPSNIGLSAAGAWKLLDFGLSAPALSAHAEFLDGTPVYLPPESFEGGDAPVARDLWATALVMFEAIAGVNPFGGGTLADVRRRITSGAPPDIARWSPVDAPLSNFLRKALSHRPDQRYSTAASMRAALAALAIPA